MAVENAGVDKVWKEEKIKYSQISANRGGVWHRWSTLERHC